MKLNAVPPAGFATVLIDPREQRRLCVDPLKFEIATLTTGDYSVKGLERFVSIERKSLEDLIGCVGRERDRFDREMDRLRAYEVRAVVVEAHWSALELGGWRGQITTSQAVGSVLGWIAAGIPFLFVGSHEAAGRAVSRLLYTAARRRWREARELISNCVDT